MTYRILPFSQLDTGTLDELRTVKRCSFWNRGTSIPTWTAGTKRLSICWPGRRTAP